MIEIYLLEQLHAVQEYGTLSAAAEHLHLAQPSVSRSMQKLEALLGVALFERRKNRIVLNDTGKLAADYARRILESEAEMEQHVKAFDHSLHTLTIGSCAPGPLIALSPATALLPNITVSSEVESEEKLIEGLRKSEYGMIILAHPLEEPDFYCTEYMTEHLYVTVNHFHPAAACESVSFADMDGQNFIMYAHVGYWDDIVRSKMPHARFLLQQDIDAVGELARSSDLPSFATDVTLRTVPSRQNIRKCIPFSDPESHVTFYIICSLQHKTLLHSLLRAM
ncbi:MAG: LysR family transcriptional regulator [Lachnospiraceae bacterium]|nr:LysR family transcriptional regulator [Lachnospiraceae bacterium]